MLPILLALAIGAVVAANAQDTRPNIVLIMTDDQGSAQLGSHGDPLLRTPHLDRLAAESSINRRRRSNRSDDRA